MTKKLILLKIVQLKKFENISFLVFNGNYDVQKIGLDQR